MKVGATAQDVLCPVALDEAWKTSDWQAQLRQRVKNYNVLDFSDWEDGGAFAAAFGKLYEGLVLHYGPDQGGAAG